MDFFFSVEGLRHHLPVRTKTRQQPPSRQKNKRILKNEERALQKQTKKQEKGGNDSVSSITLARHQKQNPDPISQDQL